ncbi:MAG: hypothetical protein BWY95_00565 [Bacteroidetes bacterium ADurb.BinA104]|nr:MAG: hypothetical protein BWY95_00565 [Bacteroidetes bacterium ADurb.BinA104]
MAIAILDSVTVSIAAVTNGRFSVMLREKRLVKEISRGSTSEYAGISSTSSKVNPSIITLSSINDILLLFKLVLSISHFRYKLYPHQTYLFLGIIIAEFINGIINGIA